MGALSEVLGEESQILRFKGHPVPDPRLGTKPCVPTLAGLGTSLLLQDACVHSQYHTSAILEVLPETLGLLEIRALVSMFIY